MRVLVTAGPTREYIDDVRYISNASSGRVGYTIAGACAARGHRVTLISGPTLLAPPARVKILRVTSAHQMLRAVVALFPHHDALIMTAAVSDYRPARRIRGKMRREERDVFLRLAPNPDILKRVRARKGGRITIGFALETKDARRRGLRKLIEKNLDYIVINSPASIESDRITCEILGRDGKIKAALANQPKQRLAAEIVKLLEKRTL